jgi:menaquinone-dependent protoporphyrinogen oxidase
MIKVIILYGTRYGSTEEISNELAKVLEENGLETTLVNLEETKRQNLPDLNEFNGILLGSSIKIGKWTKSVRKFVKKFSDELKSKQNTLGVFVSCGDGGNPDKREQARTKYIKKYLDEYGIDAHMIEAFGGVLDLTEDSNIGKIAKKMMAMAAAEEPSIKPNEKNDMRDWDRIRTFGKKFCELLG